MRELISVIIPTRNRYALLSKAIESVLNQTYDNLELIIVDDASEDPTPEVVDKYSKKIQRFKYIRNKEKYECAKARNIGVANASGKYIAFLDDDDEWLPRKIELQSKFLDIHPDVMAVSCWFIKNTGAKHVKVKKQEDITFSDMLWNNFLGSFSFVMVRPEIFKKVGFIDENLSGVDDWEFWIRVSKNCKVGVVNEFLIVYYCHPGSISQWTNNYLRRYGIVYERNKAFMNEACQRYHKRELLVNKAKLIKGSGNMFTDFVKSVRKYNVRFGRDFTVIAYSFFVLYLEKTFIKKIIVYFKGIFQRSQYIELKKIHDNNRKTGIYAEK